MKTGLKLLAETGEGLQVISAALQDAIMKVGSMRFDASAQTFTLIISRYMHEKEGGLRVKSGLQFNNVLAVKVKGIDRSDPDAYLVLLSITFRPESEEPSGDIVMTFAGGGEACLKAEFIEVRLVDYPHQRTTDKTPLHPLRD